MRSSEQWPSRSAKKMYRPSPCLRGRDSIRLRFTSAVGELLQHLDQAPGASGRPQKTIDVFQAPSGSGG